MSTHALQIASDRTREIAQRGAVWSMIATLAWAPFPLGGAIAWASGLQEILIALCWILWVTAASEPNKEQRSSERMLAGPMLLAVLTLGWATIQALPIVPTTWAHPIWSMAADTLGKSLPGTISLDPWLTETEIVKLASYILAAWLAFKMARQSDTANLILNAVIVIGSAYAAYAFVLTMMGTSQVKIFYSMPYQAPFLAGPFMLHNSFATYLGLVTVAAVAKLFAKSDQAVATGRGWRKLAHDVLQFCFGSGAPFLGATVLAFAGVVASASRAGFFSTLCGLIALALIGVLINRHSEKRNWAIVAALAVVAPLLFLVGTHGDTLFWRLGDLLASDTADVVRPSLWGATSRMIADAPLLGLGLGTFEDAYPLYASQVFPFVMDKAHSDYLEFAAGLGLPAAIAWWAALAWLFSLCILGLRRRRRDQVYCAVAIGATVLVTVHSSVDFSLQLPAVGLLYAVLLGLGVAQSASSRYRRHP